MVLTGLANCRVNPSIDAVSSNHLMIYLVL
jgi:hypothetical protein